MLEFNCRLGDPETQPILARLRSDLVDLLQHAVNGTLDRAEAEWDRRAALGVVLAAHGYPEAPRKGDVVTGLERLTAERHPDVVAFHAGTALEGDDVVTSGGRVLCVTALGESVRLAQKAAYAAVADVSFAGMQFRSDIAFRARRPQVAGGAAALRYHGASPLAVLSAPASFLPRTMDLDVPRRWFGSLQDSIVAALEGIDGTPFRRDQWSRPEGGGGVSCLLEEGNVFERAGVGFSDVRGDRLPPSATASRPELSGRAWEAMGVSLVLHPRNPYAPTVHLNVRMFAAKKDGAEPVWWFGGGMDLTPYYGFEEDAVHFHRTCREALAPFGEALYPRYKRWCDEYFYLKHRKEPRGVGGIFFDDVTEGGFERCFALTRAVGEHFVPAYGPIVLPAQGHALRRARARLPVLPPRPLCRVQPGVGPRARCSGCRATAAPRRS